MLSFLFFFPSIAFSASPVTPENGPGHITSDWCPFGDSRSDCTNPYSPMSLDIPQQLCPKFSSKSSSSMKLSLHWNNHSSFVSYDYFNCGVEKVFYEGVNFAPRKQYSCYDEGVDGWTELKIKFYTKLYQMATTSRCIKLIQLQAPSNLPTLTAGKCRTNKQLPDNPRLALLGDTTPTSVQFELPATSDTTTCTKHLVPFCYLNHGCFTTGGSCLPFGVSYSSDSFYYGYYDATAQTGSTESHDYVCEYLLMEPGTYTASTVGKFFVYPTKSYCMDTMNITVPVQAVQSIWSEQYASDDAIGQACKSPYCIFYNKTTPFTVTNGSDANHGDDEVRQMKKGLLRNSSCISPLGTISLALYSTDLIYEPKGGSCPQFYKLPDTSGYENIDVIWSTYFVATWVLLVVEIILIFVIISFCVSTSY
ncbi:hemagglutinin esterase [Bangali torovirus]|uniref:sialate O-acetylesterase n=1 Tax=Bangali torovirus TaxID=2816848 RepID=A0AAE7QQM3_9NIDO|nr:hemagglutinin esterase [Bangali torovirus]QSR83625.1 hemagglutinin esterase [Bangali torovirus]